MPRTRLCPILTCCTTSENFSLSYELVICCIYYKDKSASLLKNIVMQGVLILLGVVIRISFKRGIPKVILAAPWPAKWNVFNVI